ncbi:hypothetical protein M0813_03366 [Anaeramoeba flamelloides]|uniref:Uncharacterized protein n=1 Tax=Anaeramoeba flamelloides TaxID=1746091 RepID=A0ABQ8XZV0_9EUKA|nr:hypothetical protein M0813_03366 [Anaeramoeba flamelloides]
MSNFIDLVKLDEQIKKNEIIYQIKMTKGQNELTEEEIKLITEQIRIEKVKLSDHQTESSFIVNRIDEVNKLSREFEIFLHSDSDNESENEKEKKNEEENIEEEKEKKDSRSESESESEN